MIISAAIKLKNGSILVGKRHNDCFRAIVYFTGNSLNRVDSIQGFINDKLQFLTRTEAYQEALNCKQCEEKNNKWLASEDVW
jgi:hypothetical protein